MKFSYEINRNLNKTSVDEHLDKIGPYWSDYYE